MSESIPLGNRVALLTNFIPPYRLILYRELAQEVGELLVFLSTQMEPNRNWQPIWDGLDVHIQRSWSLHYKQKHPAGFYDDIFMHIPYDTVPELIRYRPSVVISAELGWRTAQACIYRLLFPQTRLIIWATVSEISERGRGLLRTIFRQAILRVCDHVLVNGASGRNYIESLSPRSTITEVPYVIDPDHFIPPTADFSQSSEAEGSPLRLLYVGQLIQRKGLHLALDALAKWCGENTAIQVDLRVVGDGPMRETLKRHPRPASLHVTFEGTASYETLPEVYGHADALLFPTLSDEWGIVVNEAMACGTPVLGSAYSQAVQDVVQEGVNGWVFQPDRAASMHEALDRMLNWLRSTERPERKRTVRATVAHLTPCNAASIIGAVVRDPAKQQDRIDPARV